MLESLIELTSIIKRFSAFADPHGQSTLPPPPPPSLPSSATGIVAAAPVGAAGQLELFRQGVHRPLVQLLSCTEPLILHASLTSLLYLADCSLFLELLPELPVTEPLLFILLDAPDLQLRMLAAEVLERCVFFPGCLFCLSIIILQIPCAECREKGICMCVCVCVCVCVCMCVNVYVYVIAMRSSAHQFVI